MLILNDLNLIEILQGVELVIIEHLSCLREEKEIRINQSGVWCDCKKKVDK